MTALTADTAARLERLYRLHHGLVDRVCRARTNDPHAAEDVASETWIRAARGLPGLVADDEHAGRWLAVIARRTAINHYRPKRMTERPRDWSDATSSYLLPAAAAAEDVALAGFAVVDRFAEECPPLTLVFVDAGHPLAGAA